MTAAVVWAAAGVVLVAFWVYTIATSSLFWLVLVAAVACFSIAAAQLWRRKEAK